MSSRRAIAAFNVGVILVAMTGCQAQAPAPAAPPATDAWLGRWTGPEGTFLEITGGHGTYVITIKDLDRSRSFPGAATADRIAFHRDSVPETLRATDGVGTGMKWLAGRSNCLTVKLGEGFCRDAAPR